MAAALSALPSGAGASSAVPFKLSFVVPNDFAREPVHCCSSSVRILGFWRRGLVRNSPTISVVEERTRAKDLNGYLHAMVVSRDQSAPKITFEKACGRDVAVLRSTGYREKTPVTAIQSVLLAGGTAIVVSYIRPDFDAVDVGAVRAVRHACLLQD